LSGHWEAKGPRVLIVGTGGLGCPVSLGLARGGVRRLTLMDPDRVEVTNLHRQLWHHPSDIGKPKVVSAAEKLSAAFPGLEVLACQERMTASNAEGLFLAHDLVVDATDGPQDKFLLSDTAVRTGTPLVHGGALRLSGQVMVVRPGGPCLRCFFEAPPGGDDGLSCASVGVLGSLTGVIGAHQAVLGLRVLGFLQAPSPEEGVESLWTFDGRALSQRRVRVRKAKDCPVCATGVGLGGSLEPEKARRRSC